MKPYKYSCKDWIEQKLTKEVQATRILWGVHSLFILLLANGIILNCIFDEEKNKKYTLNNKDEKLRLYNRNGINAVV